MKIEHLLEQYFEGRTTADDEAVLRRFFTTGDVPENLQIYKPLFVHFDREINRLKTNQTNRFLLGSGKRKAGKSNNLIGWLCGAAASVAILIGSFFYASLQQKCPRSGNYVIIDGRCYTDEATVRSATLQTLREVSTDGGFLPDNRSSSILDIVENQLKEFDFLLDN